MKMLTLLSSLSLAVMLVACEPAVKPANPAPATSESANLEPTKIAETTENKAPVAESVPPATVPSSVTNATGSGAPSCTLKLGFEAWEPYQYVGIDQQPAGLDIELVAAVSQKMNCQLVPQQGTWVELIAALKAGELDMLLGASKTQARQEFAFFSEPYRTEQFVLFIRSAEAASLPQATMADFLASGKKLGIVSEYYYGSEFTELYNNEQFKTQFVESSLSELNMARLLDEDIDGMLEDKFVAASMLRRKGMDKEIGPHSITLGNSDVFVMFSKISVTEEKVSAFNAAMAAIRQNGEYDAIMARYQY